MISLTVASIVPEPLVGLIWGIFFTAKSRGISIRTHFPWLVREDGSAWCVVLQTNQQVIGGLCVKEVSNSASRLNYKVAAIGLVCIAPEYRGKGYARSILDAAIAEAKIRGYDALTLWTQKQDVYTPHGFILGDDAVFGSIVMSDALIRESANVGSFGSLVERKKFPKELGLPPFALSGSVLKTANAQVVLIEDAAGSILADWSGSDTEVSVMLGMLTERKWRINAHTGDSLLDVLEVHGAKLNLSPSNLQMWLPLKKELEHLDWTQIFRFTILDRI